MSGEEPKSEIHPAADTVPKIQISATSPRESSTIYGVANELLVLKKMLSGGGDDGGFKAIAVTGVRGIGKSALCKALIQSPDVKSKYLPRIWVSMSRKFTEHENPKIALLKRILSCLGVEVDAKFPGGETVPGLLYALRLQLRSKRFLIVLDDAQEQGNQKQGNQEQRIQEQGSQKQRNQEQGNQEQRNQNKKQGNRKQEQGNQNQEQGNQEQGRQEQGNQNQEQGNQKQVIPDWYQKLNSKSKETGEELRDGFRGGKGGAVIVTSRSEKVAEAMVGEGNWRRLAAQKDPEEFWKIFEHEVEKEGQSSHIPAASSSNLPKLKEELMIKCGGLPLAAEMMGQIKSQELKAYHS